MENASKALLMAGGVLIGILILSLAAYLFADFGATSARVHQQNADKKLAEFNTKFTSYEGYKDKDDNWQITIYDIITLAGYAIENNEYYKDVDEEKIDVKIGNNSILSKSENKLINSYAYADSYGNLKRYMCSNIGYNNRGKVSSITFKDAP